MKAAPPAIARISTATMMMMSFFLPPLAGASPSAASALAGAFDMLDHSLSHCIVIHHARPASLE
jgi:hypothetical protein